MMLLLKTINARSRRQVSAKPFAQARRRLTPIQMRLPVQSGSSQKAPVLSTPRLTLGKTPPLTRQNTRLRRFPARPDKQIGSKHLLLEFNALRATVIVICNALATISAAVQDYVRGPPQKSSDLPIF